MKHWRGLAGFAVVAMAASACAGAPHRAQTMAPAPARQAAVASTGKWWTWKAVFCGPPAMVRVAGRVMPAGDCAGLFVVPARKVTLRVGEQIDVHMLGITIFTLPRSSVSAVVRRIAVAQDGATGTYRAVHAGHAILISNAWCVGRRVKGEIKGPCPVLDVTVIRAG